MPDLLILELGANDGLRGLPTARSEANLTAILEELRNRSVPVLLAGMRAAPSMGAEYEADFNAIFPNLADAFDVPLYPFFLDGVAANPELNLEDGIHPTREGVAVIVEKITPYVVEALRQGSAQDAPALQ